MSPLLSKLGRQPCWVTNKDRSSVKHPEGKTAGPEEEEQGQASGRTVRRSKGRGGRLAGQTVRQGGGEKRAAGTQADCLRQAGGQSASQPLRKGGGGHREAGTSIGPAGHPGEKADRQTGRQTDRRSVDGNGRAVGRWPVGWQEFYEFYEFMIFYEFYVI